MLRKNKLNFLRKQKILRKHKLKLALLKCPHSFPFGMALHAKKEPLRSLPPQEQLFRISLFHSLSYSRINFSYHHRYGYKTAAG